MIGPAGCFQAPLGSNESPGYYVDKCLDAGLKLTPAQLDAVNDLRHTGTIERRQLSGDEKRTYTSLEKQDLVVRVFQPFGHSYYKLTECTHG